MLGPIMCVGCVTSFCFQSCWTKEGFLGGSVVKNLSAMQGEARDKGLILGLGKSPGERNGDPLQNSGLENPMGRRAWGAIVLGITKSWTGLNTYAPPDLLNSHGLCYREEMPVTT